MIVCPNCIAELEKNNHSYFCLSCRSEFPILFENVPVAMTSPKQHIVRQLFRYWDQASQNIESEKLLSERVDEMVRTEASNERYRMLSKLNTDIFNDIEKEIISLISIQDVKKYAFSNRSLMEQKYSFNFSYLKRDWSRLENSENEIQIITKILEPIIRAEKNNKRVLFLGAASARLAYELGKAYDEVYAVDNEITMAYLFSNVRKRDIEFVDMKVRNLENMETVNTTIASSRHFESTQLEKINYILADAAQLPFLENYFDAVISIYFSDVLPLKIMFSEVKRVVRSSGLFLHYGPLEYHFQDKGWMYSFAEFKRCLTSFNFEIIREEKNIHPHCQNDDSAYKVFTNWLVAARKNELDSYKSNFFVRPSKNTSLIKASPVNFADEIKNDYYVKSNDGFEHHITESLYDLLSVIGAGCQIERIPELLKSLGYDEMDSGIILEYLNTLVNKSLIQIEDRN